MEDDAVEFLAALIMHPWVYFPMTATGLVMWTVAIIRVLEQIKDAEFQEELAEFLGLLALELDEQQFQRIENLVRVKLGSFPV